MKVPAHSTMFGAYGVYRAHTAGEYYMQYTNCTTGTQYYTSAYSPWYDGWHIYA